MTVEPAYKEIALRKQAERHSRIPKEWLLKTIPSPNVLDVRSIPRTCGILSPKELEITENYDATSLAEAIRARALTAEAVAVAFCKRAAIAQQVCNCLTEIFFEAAIERAKHLDRQYEWTGKTLGPLHGVPISLKECFKVKGYDASIGIANLAGNPAKENSLLVDILLEQGAIIYCKTNIPQTMGALDSDNHLFGRVLNPRNKLATAGGSSGGEGALIAMRGSVLGIGTDVGGSIRIPAMCNGLYGIKPSDRRVPFVGQEYGSEEGKSAIALAASAGPIATSIRDCELLLEAVSSAQPWQKDPHVAYGTWTEQGALSERPLIGVIRRDGIAEPLPPVAKALEETVQALRKAGVDVVEVDSPAFHKCQKISNKLNGLGGGNAIFDHMEAKGEPLIDWLAPRLRRGPADIPLKDLFALHTERIKIETEFLNVWRDPATGRTIDALICPVAPHPVPPIDRWVAVNYTMAFVMLDYPAGTLPVRDVQEADLRQEMQSKVLGSIDKTTRKLWDSKTIDRKVYLNTTLSVQVVAPKLQERKLYQAMKMIDDILQRDQNAKRAKL